MIECWANVRVLVKPTFTLGWVEGHPTQRTCALHQQDHHIPLECEWSSCEDDEHKTTNLSWMVCAQAHRLS